ncbi:unnamed protein product [Miscanthus lutarioriparius]|uniref:FLZ-type domain-containing protein n=1 Tax=Miscanthus lutarioriparius TaxID=422564 RepID=A0A811SPH5_9POAL|nr:unnamed protein product [Miscanthus lutarioriparius]
MRALRQAAGARLRHLHVQRDAPFCSEECRGEQMQLDAIRPRRAAARRQQQQQYSSRTESRHRESRKVSVAT